MAEKQALSFNKRRVKGRDKVGEPKDLKLKSRKLNPVNTTCYVQVRTVRLDYGFGSKFWSLDLIFSVNLFSF